MLKKGARLPQAVFTRRPTRRARFRYGSVAFFASPTSQAAVVVSKKVERSAVDRNSLKRRVAHMLRTIVPQLSESVVVYPTHEARVAPYEAVRLALEEACRSR